MAYFLIKLLYQFLTLQRESDIIKEQKYANGQKRGGLTKWHQLNEEETLTELKYPVDTKLTENK